MKKKQRWTMIINLCNNQGKMEVLELVDILNVSESTIRRDLQEMEDLNMISRYHGGARINNEQSVEPPMLIKSETNISQKKLVARLASNLIKDNQMVYIDAGSSTYEMLNYITAKNITVVTIGLPHIQMLGAKNVRTIALGGTVRWSTQAITGSQAVKQLDEMFFDIAFIGVNGIHKHLGFTTTNELEADVKSKVIKQATITYILADDSKFNKLFPVKYGSLNQAIILSNNINDFDPSAIKYILTNGENNL